MRPRTVLVATFGLLLAGTIANGAEETTAPDVKLYDDLDAATLEGEADKAVSEAQRAVAIDPLDGHATGMLCFILWATGRSPEAIPILEQGYEDRDPVLVTTRVWPQTYGGPLAEDPRFEPLLKRIGWK